MTDDKISRLCSKILKLAYEVHCLDSTYNYLLTTDPKPKDVQKLNKLRLDGLLLINDVILLELGDTDAVHK